MALVLRSASSPSFSPRNLLFLFLIILIALVIILYSISKRHFTITASPIEVSADNVVKIGDSDNKIKAASEMPVKKDLAFWSSDLHDGCRADTASLLQYLNQTVILAGQKRRANPYAKLIFTLPNIIFAHEKRALASVIESHIAHSTSLSEADIKSFHSYYALDPLMASVDAFYCSFPASFCEAYMPFNKSIIWLPAHRFTLGRCSKKEFKRLITHLQLSAQDSPNRPKHFVAAGGRYDLEYIKYYTGLDAIFLPVNSLFYAYNVGKFTQSRAEILVGPLRVRDSPWFVHMRNASARAPSNIPKFVFSTAILLYDFYSLEQLSAHRVVVVLPYAVLSYGITELYTVGIPMFIPSIEFIVQLAIVRDRILPHKDICAQLKFEHLPPQHPKSNHPYSPDLSPDVDIEAFKYWIKFADYYQLPYIQTFDSWDDLIMKLANTNFQLVHDQMMTENEKRRSYLIAEWTKIIEKIEPNRIVPKDYQQAIATLWGKKRLQAL